MESNDKIAALKGGEVKMVSGWCPCHSIRRSQVIKNLEISQDFESVQEDNKPVVRMDEQNNKRSITNVSTTTTKDQRYACDGHKALGRGL